MKIAVIGMGYVGMSLAVLLSQKNSVIAYDILPEKVNMVNNKKSPIRDEDIEEAFKQEVLNLTATNSFDLAVINAECVVIATPTNYNPETCFFDTSSVEECISKISDVNKNTIIIVKSTLPIGFTEKINNKVENIVLFMPEFLREGQALYDNLYPSRVVVGTNKQDANYVVAAQKVADLFISCAKVTDIPKLIVGYTEAEAIKLFANTYLALRISYFNELDTYAELNGLNSRDIIDGVCLDSRIGNFYNNPSFGYGGYCLPKDTKQLLANYCGIPENLIESTVESNITRKKHIVDSIKSRIKKLNKQSCQIGIYRLTMKAGSDNFRESSILDIIKILNDEGYSVIIYEPLLNDETKYKENTVVIDLNEFKSTCDIIVANRYDETLEDVIDKVYTRDLYGCL